MSQGIASEPRQTPLPVGVNLAGFFAGTRGIAEAARQVRGALEAAGAAGAPVALDEGAAPSEAPFPVTVVCTNPEGIEGAYDRVGRVAFDGRRVVGLWWWE